MTSTARDLPTLRQLEYFVALVEEGAFAAAARRCGISQPSLSAQLANLERRVGLTLIERARSGAVPTPAGREIYARGLELLAGARAIAEFATRGGAGLTGTVRFGASSTMGPYLMPQVVAALHAAHPDLRLYIREGAPRPLLEDLLRGDLDLILTQLPVQAEDALVLRLFREPVELVLPRDHPLAARETVARADLAGARVLSLGPAYGLHALVAGLCETLNMRLLRDYEGTSLDAVRLMVGMGMGIAFLPALYVRSSLGAGAGDVVVRRLDGPRIMRSAGLAVRTGRPVAFETATRLAAILRQLVRDSYADLLRLEEASARGDPERAS